MTTQTVYRLLCDAPRCTAMELIESLAQIPGGWRKLKSTDHIPIPSRQPAYGRRKSRTLTYSEQCRGAFTLHLCPQHPGAFDGHLPRTDGMHTRPGKTTQANVSCSCGLSFGLCITSFRVASADMSGPDAYTEKLWWRHLPTELQWYSDRETGQVA